MTEPPKYPRTPYLWPQASMSTSDRTVSAESVQEWFTHPVLVEEKVDGANVTVWQDRHGVLQVASRGGLGATDRGQQLGRLRAWVAERSVSLTEATAEGKVLYGEWLWVRHGVAYNALPDWFVLLDVWTASTGMVAPGPRQAVAEAVGLVLPPLRFEGVLGTAERLTSLFGESAFGAPRAEGLVLRLDDGRRCKVVDPEFVRLQDWDPTVHNSLAVPEPPLH